MAYYENYRSRWLTSPMPARGRYTGVSMWQAWPWPLTLELNDVPLKQKETNFHELHVRSSFFSLTICCKIFVPAKRYFYSPPSSPFQCCDEQEELLKMRTISIRISKPSLWEQSTNFIFESRLQLPAYGSFHWLWVIAPRETCLLMFGDGGNRISLPSVHDLSQARQDLGLG